MPTTAAPLAALTPAELADLSLSDLKYYRGRCQYLMLNAPTADRATRYGFLYATATAELAARPA